MAVTVHEVERKYQVNVEYRMPDLGELPGVRAVEAPREQELVATYFDTPDLRLAVHSVTLRRRTGGDDAGWHLKLPVGGDERTEIQLPLGRGARTTPPRELQERIEVYVRGGELVPVAELATRRIVYRLLGARGAVLAEVADDTVTATVPTAGTAPEAGPRTATRTAPRLPAGTAPAAVNGSRAATETLTRAGSGTAAATGGAGTAQAPAIPDAAVSSWREVEVELVRGGRRLLSAAGELLAEAGASPSPTESKLRRVLADRLPHREPPCLPAGTAGAAVMGYLREQVAELQALDLAVRDGEPDSVHQMRVTIRRLRSALATFRPVFRRSFSEPVRAELKWLGGVLGAARDIEVIAEKLLASVRAEPPELLLGPVAGRIRTTLTARQQQAMTQVRAELSGRRYFDLLDALDRLLVAPPLTGRATESAGSVLRKRTRAAWERTRLAADQADAAAPGVARETALHEVRKAAKRARYAAEAAGPVLGKPAESFGRQMKSVQTLLGDHQDTVIICAELRQFGARAHLAGENGFSFGRLHAQQQALAERLRDSYPETWRAASDKRHRRWMKT